MKADVLSAAGAAVAGLANAQSAVKTVHIPLNLAYGYNEKIHTTVTVPATNVSIPVVYDSGSENFFLFGPNSTARWGSSLIGSAGPCHAPVPTGSLFDYTQSSTATQPVNHSVSFVYGGADKIYQGSATVNDSFVFGNTAGQSENVQDARVELIDELILRIADNTNCTAAVQAYDTGILGISPFFNNASTRVTAGPSFRHDLLERQAIDANVQSLWFDEAPESVYGTFTGGGLLGGIDTSKYTGPLVKVSNPAAGGAYAGVGYFTAIPTVSVDGQQFSKPDGYRQCQLDSGTHDDSIPVAYQEDEAFYNATGLTLTPIGYLAWPGACESIPANKTIDFTFPGATAGESVMIKVPLRNYVRVQMGDEAGYCPLSLSTSDCVLGSPFHAAAFFAADDERFEIALAQGGVSARGAPVDESKVVARIP